MKKILLTFDYELFLGIRSGSVQKCLITPTKLVLNILKKSKAKAIFFVDTTYIFRLKELSLRHESCKNDLNSIVDQLNQIIQDGHYLFHHLHPHWLDATYLEEINEWDLSKNSRFSFNDISEDERLLIFEFSHTFLKELYVQNGKDILPEGYRAGGLYIEPFENFKKYFRDFGIKYEFSVVPEMYKEGKFLFYDFRGAPKTPYRFGNKITEVDEYGDFKQFPVSNIEIRNFNKILNSFYFRIYKNSKLSVFGDGNSVSNSINNPNKVSKKRFFSQFSMTLPLSVELLNPVTRLQCEKWMKQHDYIHFLSHPKLLSQQSLDSMDVFLSKMNRRYTIEFDFINI